jgi:hypothetical protein
MAECGKKVDRFKSAVGIPLPSLVVKGEVGNGMEKKCFFDSMPLDCSAYIWG